MISTEQLEEKVKALTEELTQAETELAKLKPRVQYLEMIIQRCDGAITVLQGLKQQDAPPVVGTNHSVAPVGV